jgi:tetratricopeptide (TPR) repeat protein
LLLRAFAATGDRDAVDRQLATSEDLFRKELGVAPGPAVYRAAEIRRPHPASASGGRAASRALLDAGEAAVAAGAIDLGLQNLRRAAAGAGENADRGLESAALLALGSGLIHAARSRDEEGAVALHQAIAAADRTGAIAAAAHRELGYVELLRGEYPSALAALGVARGLAGEDRLELARIEAVTGLCLSDMGSHGAAEAALGKAVRLATETGNGKQLAWSLAFLGRNHLLQDRLEAAERALSRSLELASEHRWTAFVSCPEALLAEVWLRRGELDRAEAAFEHALALGSEVDDACWEAYGLRGRGLVLAARGEPDSALTSLQDATTRCLRERDTYQWIRAYSLDAMCATAVAIRHEDAGRYIDELASLSARAGMREMTVRAYLHRRDLGDEAAIKAARALATPVDNHHLLELLTPAAPRLLDELLGRVGVSSPI